MELQLTKYAVTLKDEMNWGDSEQIQAVVMSSLKIDASARKQIERGDDAMDIKDMQLDGSAVLDSKVKSAEVIITKIVVKDVAEGQSDEVKFTRDWLFSLSQSDGAKLMSAIDEVRSKSGADTEVEGK